MATFIKTALCLHHHQIPSSLFFEEPNPEIPFSQTPFYVNTQLKNWNSPNNLPLRAGVSSFGAGGANACRSHFPYRRAFVICGLQEL